MFSHRLYGGPALPISLRCSRASVREFGDGVSCRPAKALAPHFTTRRSAGFVWATATRARQSARPGRQTNEAAGSTGQGGTRT